MTASAFLAVVLLWAVWLVLGPTLRLLWRERRALAQALVMRVTQPKLWHEIKAEMKRDGEWL